MTDKGKSIIYTKYSDSLCATQLARLIATVDKSIRTHLPTDPYYHELLNGLTRLHKEILPIYSEGKGHSWMMDGAGLLSFGWYANHFIFREKITSDLDYAIVSAVYECTSQFCGKPFQEVFSFLNPKNLPALLLQRIEHPHYGPPLYHDSAFQQHLLQKKTRYKALLDAYKQPQTNPSTKTIEPSLATSGSERKAEIITASIPMPHPDSNPILHPDSIKTIQISQQINAKNSDPNPPFSNDLTAHNPPEKLLTNVKNIAPNATPTTQTSNKNSGLFACCDKLLKQAKDLQDMVNKSPLTKNLSTHTQAMSQNILDFKKLCENIPISQQQYDEFKTKVMNSLETIENKIKKSATLRQKLSYAVYSLMERIVLTLRYLAQILTGKPLNATKTPNQTKLVNQSLFAIKYQLEVIPPLVSFVPAN